MPGMRPKKEKMRDRNDSLIIVKADGGLVEADNVYQEFGELHSDEDGATIDVQQKIPVFEPTVVGQPPIQKRTIYYIDEEPQDCGFDPYFMFSKLKSAYVLSASGETTDADNAAKHKRTMDMVFTAAAVFLLLFAFVLSPLFGIRFSGTGTQTTAPQGAPENSFPTPTPVPMSRHIQTDIEYWSSL